MNQPPPPIIFCGPTSFARSVGRSVRSFVRSFVRSLARWLGSCALVSIHRMGLMGTLCVGSAEKRAGSIRGTGGPRVLSYLWWGVLLDDRRDPLGPRGGGTREGLHRSIPLLASLSPPLHGPPTLSRSLRWTCDVYTALHTGADGIDNDPRGSRHLFPPLNRTLSRQIVFDFVRYYFVDELNFCETLRVSLISVQFIAISSHDFLLEILILKLSWCKRV